MLLAGMPAGAPTAIDARAARWAFRPAGEATPVCCARGAPIDARHKPALARLWPELGWSPEGPTIEGIAPSGVVHRLASVPHCGALLAIDGGVRGEACGLRDLARRNELREDAFLLDGCALFPLDVEGEVLVPSPRIPEEMLADAATDEPSLWDEARERFTLRFGLAATTIVDVAALSLRARRSRGLHLKTLR
jgi:hypothetical protein